MWRFLWCLTLCGRALRNSFCHRPHLPRSSNKLVLTVETGSQIEVSCLLAVETALRLYSNMLWTILLVLLILVLLYFTRVR